MALVLRGGAVLTVNAANEFLPSADVRIEGTTIAATGAAGTLARAGDEVIDATDTLYPARSISRSTTTRPRYELPVPNSC